MNRRYRLAGLAHPRAVWFGEVGRWATTAAIPAEFVKCLNADELRSMVDAGQALSAALVDLSAAGVDRDLLEDLRRAGITVIAVARPDGPRPPAPVDVVLYPGFGPAELAERA